MADKKAKEKQSYDQYKEARRAAAADASRSGRDIDAIPPVRNPQRRTESERSFRSFCEAYFPQTFNLPWSDDHLKVMAAKERVVREGGLFAIAMPRGTGKTTLCESLCLWSILTGQRTFVVLIGSNERHARTMMESIKTELSTNELLLEDFPEATYPIHCLEGITQRCKGQLHQGKQTHIGWTDKSIVMPTIAGSASSGAIIRVAGITGGIRGMKFKRPDGQTVRPDLAVLDDPQTDESARSVSQCAEREALINGAVLGLAGPSKKIAAIMPCTVVRAGDLADTLLDRKKHPEWQGVRTKLVYQFPRNEKLWQEYAETRAEGLRNEDGGKAGNAFYAARQPAMDDGAVIAWPQRFNPDEISAIQHAMNLRLTNEAAFFAEYQNEPIVEQAGDSEALTVDAITAKANAIKRRVVPAGLSHLVAMIDVQARALYYAVVAWADRFDGQVVDYGTYPDQQLHYFTYRKVQRTLKRAKPGSSDEAAIYAGLEALTDQLLGHEWKVSGGAVMRIERVLIDSGWNNELIHKFCRESKHAALLAPSKGMAIGASNAPMGDWQKRPGDRVGTSWRMPGQVPRGGVRHVVFDANHWKSFVHERLAAARGDAGCLQLFAGTASQHRMLAEHLTAEYRVRTSGRGRQVDEWKPKPGEADNHLLDCLVGCAVAASMSGCALVGKGEAVAARGKRLSLSEVQRRKRSQGALP